MPMVTWKVDMYEVSDTDLKSPVSSWLWLLISQSTNIRDQYRAYNMKPSSRVMSSYLVAHRLCWSTSVIERLVFLFFLNWAFTLDVNLPSLNAILVPKLLSSVDLEKFIHCHISQSIASDQGTHSTVEELWWYVHAHGFPWPYHVPSHPEAAGW